MASLFKAIILSIPLLLLTKVFGFMDWNDLPLIPLRGVGNFWFVDIILIFLLIVAIGVLVLYRKPIYKGPLFFIILLFTIYIGFQGFRNYYIEEYPIGLLLNGLRGVFYYLYFFVLVLIIRDKKDMYRFLVVCWCIGSISAVTTILFYFNILETKTINISMFSIYQYSNIPVIYPSAEYLFDSCFFVLLSLYLAEPFIQKYITFFSNYKKYSLFSVILIALAMIISFARSTISTAIAGFCVIFFVLHKMRIYKLIPFLLSLTLSIVLFNFIMVRSFGSGFDALIAKVIGGYYDVREESGSFGDRMEILKIKYRATTDYNFLIGRGFNWGLSSGIINPDRNPMARSNHNGLVSIYVVFGVLGIIVYAIIFFIVGKKCIYIFNNSANPIDKHIALGILIFNVMLIIKSFVTDPFTDPSGAIVISISWGIIGKTDQLQRLEWKQIHSRIFDRDRK